MTGRVGGGDAERRAGHGQGQGAGRWVLLSYRLPREPSTPRIGVWRKLERLGAARLGDGLEIGEAGGNAAGWLATPASAAQERAVAQAMRTARAAEYQAVVVQARTAAGGAAAQRARTARRLRAELRRIARRDFFPPAERDAARAAVNALTGDTNTEAAQATSPAIQARS